MFLFKIFKYKYDCKYLMKKEEVHDELKIFFKTFSRSFVPSQYPELSKRHIVTALKFFTSSLMILIFLSIIISIPKIMSMPSSIENQLSQFNSVEFTMNGAVLIPNNNPLFIFDTTNQYENVTSLIYATNDMISVKDHIIMFSDSENLSKLLFLIFLILLPGFLILVYFIYLIKFIILVLLFTFIVKVILQMLNYYCSFKHLFVSAIYASPILMLITTLNMFFVINLYYVQYLLYFLFYLLIAFKISRHKGF